MIVKVKFWKPEIQGFAGKEYAYLTDLDLRVNDKVVAPTARNPEQAAVVVETNCKAENLSLSYLSVLKTIEKKWEGALPK